jgi:hypothetical protein
METINLQLERLSMRQKRVTQRSEIFIIASNFDPDPQQR